MEPIALSFLGEKEVRGGNNFSLVQKDGMKL